MFPNVCLANIGSGLFVVSTTTQGIQVCISTMYCCACYFSFLITTNINNEELSDKALIVLLV